MEHLFDLTHPNCFAAILIFFNIKINRFKSRRTMMLWPVKFNTTRYPWTGKANQCRLYYPVIINKMIIVCFIKCHLDTSAQFGKYHDFQVLILEKNSFVYFVFLFIIYFI